MIYQKTMLDAEIDAMIEEEPIGHGTARVAYCLKNDPNSIVKKSVGSRHYSNILEWSIWLAAADHPELRSILGQCHCLSESGKYLVMERLDDINAEDYKLIPDVPVWFNDRKPSAFGKSGGVIKIRDYGMITYGEFLNRQLTKPPAFAVEARMKALFRGRASQ